MLGCRHANRRHSEHDTRRLRSCAGPSIRRRCVRCTSASNQSCDWNTRGSRRNSDSSRPGSGCSCASCLPEPNCSCGRSCSSAKHHNYRGLCRRCSRSSVCSLRIRPKRSTWEPRDTSIRTADVAPRALRPYHSNPDHAKTRASLARMAPPAMVPPGGPEASSARWAGSTGTVASDAAQWRSRRRSVGCCRRPACDFQPSLPAACSDGRKCPQRACARRYSLQHSHARSQKPQPPPCPSRAESGLLRRLTEAAAHSVRLGW